MQYTILHRYTREKLFIAEIDAVETEAERKRLAVLWLVRNTSHTRGAHLRRVDLSGADLTRADLSGADLTRADLSRADLSDADLSGANLTRAKLIRADLTRADLTRADMGDANLYCARLDLANLSGADLSRAELHFARLNGVDLHGARIPNTSLRTADLHGAVGIVSFGPVGFSRRIGYAVAHDAGPMVRLACFWGTLDAACDAIREKYGDNSSYEALVRAACENVKETR